MNGSVKIISVIAIAIALFCIVVGIICHNTLSNTPSEEETPILSITFSQMSNSNETINSANITKGDTLAVNLDLLLNANRTELDIPLYLSVSAFENKPSIKVIAFPPPPYPSLPWPEHDDSANMTKPFEANFNPNPINSKPGVKTSVTLKITALDEAQLGTYTLMVELGDWKKTGIGGALFYLTVIPK